MPKRAFRYAVVDAFTDEPFRGNSAAVCLLDEDGTSDGAEPLDERWMQAVAAEFNTPITAFLVRSGSSGAGAAGGDAAVVTAQFRIRWFTPVRESELCGHGTLAAAHYLIASGLVECDAIEFVAKSGRLTAKKVTGSKYSSPSAQHTSSKFMIEMDFPVIPVVKCNSAETLPIPETLNGASVINELQAVSNFSDLIVEVSSCDEVDNVCPNIAELVQCPGRGVAVTGPAHEGSSYDFVTRFFSPKYGINEDPVCASVHCSLAPYWGKKLGKHNMTAFMASPRSGTLYLQWDEEAQRVRIQGEAVTVMVGSLLA
ncbi:putative isomerase BH0283 [Dichanthelium oligosanthes]|uniref:Putative isomerase BH0283 n=1 Tax=Dichanthelium oligosanthes TaxID=888268 RepID=A0A1E5WBQ4_9POAL|nr:putative isomerase BH0283 [Dichanthelium oligosanthes]